MSILVRDADALKSVSGVAVRRSGGLKQAASIWMRTVTGALKLIWTSFEANLSSATVEGGVTRYRSMNATTSSVTVEVSGGVPPYTYLWTRTDSDIQYWEINNGDTATASFSSMVDNGQELTATFHCKVTDASGASITTPDVTATLFNGWIEV